MESDPLQQVEQLIAQARLVLLTHRPNPRNVIGFPTLESGAFTKWQTQTLRFLERVLGAKDVYTQRFRTETESGFKESVETGIAILQAVKEDLASGSASDQITPKPDAPTQKANALTQIAKICDRFHVVARQLRSRHESRPTLSVSDEYDVQDLFHALLRLEFEDIRAEEYAPSYAGRSTRMDFLVKREQIVVELKKTRTGLGAREIGSQLIEDTARYERHPDCTALVCFVYDPEGLIVNPRGVEDDLSRSEPPFPVRVFIRPG